MLIPLMLVLRNKPEEKGLAPDGYYPGLNSATNLSSRSENKIVTAVLHGESKTVAQATKTRAFWLLSTTHLICGIGCGLMMTHTVIFATDLGYSAMIGASFLSVQGGVNLVGVLFTGPLSDRIARNRALSLTHLVRGISFVVLVIALLIGGGPLWMLYPAMALFGFGWFTTAPLMAGLAADLFGYLKMGTIIGIVMSFHMVGMAIGTYAGGISFSLTHSYLPVFLIQGILELTAAFCAFVIVGRRQKRE
jgi:MFS family permease